MTRSRLIAVVRTGCYGGVLALLAYQLVRHREDVLPAMAAIGWGRFTGCVAIAVAGAWLGMAGWRVLLAGFGTRLPTPVAARVYFVAGLGRYLPGGLWPALAHADVARRLREPPGRLAGAFLASVLLSTVAGLLVGLIALPTLVAVQPAWWIVVPVLATGLLVVMAPQVTRTVSAVVRRRTGRTIVMPRPRVVLGAIGLMVAGWLLTGVHLMVLTSGLGVRGWTGMAVMIGGFALASVAGVLAVVLPAGLGAREAVLGLTLAVALNGSSLAATVAVVAMSRLVVTAGDLLAATATTLVRLRPPDAPATKPRETPLVAKRGPASP